jgi:hypothetical protein
MRVTLHTESTSQLKPNLAIWETGIKTNFVKTNGKIALVLNQLLTNVMNTYGGVEV